MATPPSRTAKVLHFMLETTRLLVDPSRWPLGRSILRRSARNADACEQQGESAWKRHRGLRRYFLAGSSGTAGGADVAAVAGVDIGMVGVTKARDVVAPPMANVPRSGTIINATMLMILMSGLTAGPAVSLYGSPTVSPVTAALCASDPLPP